MPSPLSMDLRKRLIAAHLAEEGTHRQLAQRFGIGPATAMRWITRYNRTGSFAPHPTGGRKPVLTEDDLESIDLLVHDHPTDTVAELQEKFEAEAGPHVSPSTIHRAFKKLKITRKKTLRSPRKAEPPG